MNMLSISSALFDLNSPVELEILPTSSLQEISRRVTRTPTLDLGVSITDNGFSHGDRIMKIQARVSEVMAGILLYLIQTYSILTFSLPEGIFSGVIDNYINNDGNISFFILINEKLNED